MSVCLRAEFFQVNIPSAAAVHEFAASRWVDKRRKEVYAVCTFEKTHFNFHKEQFYGVLQKKIVGAHGKAGNGPFVIVARVCRCGGPPKNTWKIWALPSGVAQPENGQKWL